MRPTLAFLASLLLIGCQEKPPPTVYTTSPEITAVFAGQARGADFSIARACGADIDAVRARAADEPVPSTLGDGAGAIYKAALIARAAETAVQPTPAVCSTLRNRYDLAGLFPNGRPAPTPVRVTRGAGTAYCAEGTEAVRRDPSMTVGLEAIRENCRPGDTIALPADAIGIIASVCDLSRPAPSSGGNVFCTIGHVRQIRAPGPKKRTR